MNRIFKQVIVIGLFVYIPVVTMAWGQLGHRIIGEIASNYLTPKAKIAVEKILGNESIAMASNWADFIKSDTSYRYLNSWHYIDFKEGLTEDEFVTYLKNDTLTDAYTKINFLVKELKNDKLEADKKLMYLRLLIHIVGDVHQPMHTGRPEDMGGNKIKLTWFNQPTNLHAVWDDKILESQQLSYTEYVKAINYTTPILVNKWQTESVSTWLLHSHQIAEKIYSEVTPDDKLSYRYIFEHVSIVNSQLLEGGVHLAGLLNQIFN